MIELETSKFYPSFGDNDNAFKFARKFNDLLNYISTLDEEEKASWVVFVRNVFDEVIRANEIDLNKLYE